MELFLQEISLLIIDSDWLATCNIVYTEIDGCVGYSRLISQLMEANLLYCPKACKSRGLLLQMETLLACVRDASSSEVIELICPPFSYTMF